MGRKKLGITIDEDTWKLFKAWVKHKYGYERGVLSKEVEIALRIHMNPDKSRVIDVDQLPATSGSIPDGKILHTHTSKPTGKYDDLIDNFQNEFSEDEQISRGDLEKFIIKYEDVSDPRAIENRINFLRGKSVLEDVVDSVDIYRNALFQTEKISLMGEDNYTIVENFLKGRTTTESNIKNLPPDIQKALNKLSKDQYDEFVTEG